jgi:hypothetical protein
MSFDKEIESFTFGPKGSVWVLIREGFQFDRTENLQVVQYLEGDQLSKPVQGSGTAHEQTLKRVARALQGCSCKMRRIHSEPDQAQ